VLDEFNLWLQKMKRRIISMHCISNIAGGRHMKINDVFGNSNQLMAGSKRKDQKSASDFSDAFAQAGASLGRGTAPTVPVSFHETDSPDGLESTDAGKSANDKLLEDFAKWSKMTPAERIRAQYLEAHGMTESSLSQLPEDVRKAIEDDIKAQIKQQLQDKSKETTDSAMPTASL
jgi:hypothetical protein